MPIKKIFKLLNKKEKKNFLIVLFLILIMGLSEMFGVASIFPLIALITNEQIIETNQYISKIYEISMKMGIKNIKDFLSFFGFLVFFILIFSILMRAYTLYMQMKFYSNLQYNLSKRLIENYLHQPYNWFLSRNTADISKNILSDIENIIFQTIIPLINIITQTTVAVLLTFLLIIIDPYIAFSVCLILGISYLCIFYFIKKILSRFSLLSFNANQARYRALSEALGAIKEVKFLGLEKLFAQRYIKSYGTNIELGRQFGLMQQLPRYLIETVTFGGIIFLTLLLDRRADQFQNTLAMIGLYIFAGYRLIPSLQNIYFSLSQIRFSNPSLNLVYNDLKKLKFESNKNFSVPIELKKNISLKSINYFYPSSKYAAVKNINITIPVFSKVGIVGVTGSGKTTILDIILGLLDPSKGTLKIDGILINSDNKRNWQKNIGYVPQQINLLDASIAENIAFGVERHLIDYKALEQAAKIASLHDFIIKDLPKQYETIIGEKGVRLSGGQRQRIGIARALYPKPKVIILDEATNAQDNFTESLIISAINKLDRKITSIIISHRLSLVKNCDNIFLLDKGRLINQGSFQELRSNLLFKKIALNNFK